MSIYDINGRKQTADTVLMPRQNGNAWRTQQLIAHKGGIWGAPLESLWAYEIALEKGFTIVEGDVEVTSDGIPVMMHGNSINTYARNKDGSQISGTVNVYNHTYEQLSTYDYGIRWGSKYAGTELLKLDDLLAFCRRNGLCLHCDLDSTYNAAENARIVYETVKKRNMLDYVMFDMMNETVADAFTSLDTGLVLQIQRSNTNKATADALAEAILPKCRQLVYAPPISGYGDREFIDYIHSLGMHIRGNLGDGHGGYVDTVPGSTTPADIRTAFDMGVDFFIADNITPGEVL